MKKIKLAYFGSPDFAADFLEKILLDKNLPVEVRLVVTQPDQKVGRKQILTPTPVKEMAKKYKIQTIEIGRWKMGIETGIPLPNQSSIFQSVDLTLVYAYGDLISKELLSLPKYGLWNIHPSLLPKYRGPSPIATPLINGDKTTGVTIIKMDEEIDHGPIIAQESLTIKDTDYRPDLEKKLTNLAYEMFKRILKNEDTFFETIARGPHGGVAVEKNGVEFLVEQNHKEATFTKKLSKNDGFISFENLKSALIPSPYSLIAYNLFRGLYPWPGIWTLLPNGKRLKITQLEMKNEKLIIDKVQLEGKNEVNFETFNDAYKIF